MRLSRLISVTVVAAVVSAATIFACGGGGDHKADAQKVFMDSKVFLDAPPGNPLVTGLGQLCPFGSGGAGSACPAADSCVKLTGLGSDTTGYCTPNCMGSNSICTTGYMGPAGGMPVCALTVGSGSAATGCAIICTDVSQCPGGMTCVVAQGTTKICVPT